MVLDDSDLDLIERYLEGALDAEAEKLIKAKMIDSPEFAKEVAFQRRVLAQIQAEEKSRMKTEMLADFRKVKAEHSAKKMPRKRPMWYMAAAVVLIGTLYFVLDREPSSQELFSTYYQAYDGVVINRGDTQSITDGLNAYNNQDFEPALTVFLNLKEYDIEESQLQLLIGNCYLSLGQTEEALVWLRKIGNSESENIVNNRDWYIALALLQSGNVEAAKTMLMDIIKSDNIYADKSSTLLEEAVFK